MKNLLLILLIAVIFTSCSTRSGKVGNINPNDITYYKDTRTGLCFALIGAKKGANLVDESESIGMSCVPCDKVEKYLKK